MEQRLEVRLREPNPLFTRWLERWLRAAEKGNKKSQFPLREALLALRSYPLPLQSGRDCAVLRGFGGTLCQLIDEELRQHRLRQAPEQTLPSCDYEAQVQKVVQKVQQQRPRKAPTKKEQRLRAEQEERERVVCMEPGTFQVLLLVDTAETSGKNKRLLDQTRSYLESLGVANEIRRLTVGDFLWIARDKEGSELVLPYVVERKRMDDLAASLRDGRFHEQKHRLKQSGLRHVVYLVEDYGDNEQLGLPLESLEQALCNARVQAGVQVVRTENHYRSMSYLAAMTRSLQQLFGRKTLHSSGNDGECPVTSNRLGLLKFRALYEDSAKNSQLTVREVFVQQLLQLHSLSLDRALAIVERFATPRQLLDAFEECASEKEAIQLLGRIPCGPLERPLGDKIGQCLYEFYTRAFR